MGFKVEFKVVKASEERNGIRIYVNKSLAEKAGIRAGDYLIIKVVDKTLVIEKLQVTSPARV